VKKGATTNLSLVLAATTLKVVAAEIGNRDQTTQVADVDAVRITDLKQTLTQELSCSVSDLTITLHLAEPQAAISEHAQTSQGFQTWPHTATTTT